MTLSYFVGSGCKLYNVVQTSLSKQLSAMRRQQPQQPSAESFKVAPLMSPQNEQAFYTNLLMTLSGIHKALLSLHRLEQTLLLFPVLLIVPLVVDNQIVAVVVPTAVIVILNLIEDALRAKIIIEEGQEVLRETAWGENVIKRVVLGCYVFLWANHLYYLKHSVNGEVYNIVLSALSILTSLYTIARLPVKEFMANGVDNSSLSLGSTLYMRFLIIFLTLLAQFIIFNSAEQSGVDLNSGYLLALRVFNSFSCVIWWFGWLSTLETTLHYIFNCINTIVYGDQQFETLRLSILMSLLNTLPIAVYLIVNHFTQSITLIPFIAGSTLISLTCFFITLSLHNRYSYVRYTRSIIMILYQLAVCGVLLGLYIGYQQGIKQWSLTALLVVDTAVYVLGQGVKEMFKAWSYLAINTGFEGIVKYRHIAMLQRIMLRFISGLSVLLLILQHQQTLYSLNYPIYVIIRVALPFLAYRTFKRTITQTTTLSLHLSLLLALILVSTQHATQGILIVLFMPPFSHSFWVNLVSIFRIPPKLQHQKQCQYQIGYALATTIGVLLHLLTLGTMELTMIFGLPIYWPVIPTHTSGHAIKSSETSLYEKILLNIPKQTFYFYPQGFYLLRIEKYILLIHLKSNLFGFAQLISIKGLQVQEVTSCHSKEGQTIDQLVQQTWGDHKERCCVFRPYGETLTPFLREKVNVPTQNEMQLVGVLQDKQFVQMFKQSAFKSIVRQYSKMPPLTENQHKQAQIIMSELSAIFKKDPAEQVFPFSFSEQCNLKVSYPSQNYGSNGKVRLPPLGKGGKKPQVINDFMDLLGESGDNSKFQSSNTNFLQKPSKAEQINPSSPKAAPQPKPQEINMSLLLTFYYYTLHKNDYINTQKLYKLIKREPDVVSQIQFDGFSRLISLALGTAFKICVEKYIEGQTEVTLDDFTQYDKSSFLGTSDSEEFKQAILQDKPNIWTLNYQKRTLSVNRLAQSQTTMYIFQASPAIIKSVWNNLRFQLIYATNNDDERYSIQTHPQLMRNLWVQACEEPFGYPSYHSQTMTLL